MKSFFTSLCFLCIALSMKGQILFEHGTWSEIKSKAKLEHKLIFVDAYTTWCGPCKWMAKNIFTNDTVARYFNAHFINAKMDMEAGEGITLAKRLQINVYPSLLFIDSDGGLVHKGVGSMDAHAFVQLGTDAQNPQLQYASLEKQFKEGNREGSFLLKYLKVLQEAGYSTEQPLSDYFAAVPQENMIQPENWKLLYAYEMEYNSKAFRHVLANIDRFSTRFSGDSVSKLIFRVVNESSWQMVYSDPANGLTNYESLRKTIAPLSFKGKEELLLNTDLRYYDVKKDTNNYAITAASLADNYKRDDLIFLNNTAWWFYERIKDKSMLQKAEGWSKKSVDADPSSAPMDTYAHLLFVNGKRQEAIVMEEKALKMEKESTESDSKFIQSMEEQIALFKKTNN